MDPFMENFRDRSRLEGFCGRCPYKLICGGCRARAYNYFGDVLAPRPRLHIQLGRVEEVAGGYTED